MTCCAASWEIQQWRLQCDVNSTSDGQVEVKQYNSNLFVIMLFVTPPSKTKRCAEYTGYTVTG